MTHRLFSIPMTIVFAALPFSGCYNIGTSDENTDGGGDLDADSDTDADADTDADTDIDIDVDTDTDTDTDITSELQYGSVTVCFAEPGDIQPSEKHTWEIAGTVDAIIPVIVMSSIPFPGCEATYLVGIDDGKDVWKVGYRVMSSQSQDVSPELSLKVGQKVTLTVVKGSTWGTDLGFSIVDDTGLVAAFEEGFQGKEPYGKALDGIVVDMGDQYNATIQASCGIKHGHELVFKARSTIRLRNEEAETLNVNGYDVTAMNVATYTYDELYCTDIWGPKSWAIFR